MTCYINPPDQDKVDWLLANGERIPVACPITPTHLPVCLVDNGPFTAAGICLTPRDRHRFSDPLDDRPKVWFKVSREKLREVSDLEIHEKYEQAGVL